MGDFFQGWRRKVGCITLVVACVFMIGWVRTPFVAEAIVCPLGRHAGIAFIAIDGRVGLLVLNYSASILGAQFPSYESQPFQTIESWAGDSTDVLQIYPLGLGILISEEQSGLDVGLFIPFWFIVVPLTVLSAWLLLTKPKQPIAKPVDGSLSEIIVD